MGKEKVLKKDFLSVGKYHSFTACMYMCTDLIQLLNLPITSPGCKTLDSMI